MEQLFRGDGSMSVLGTIAILLVMAALFSYVNDRFLRMTRTIGLMLSAFVVTMAIMTLDYFGVNVGRAEIAEFLNHVNFSALLLNGVLCFLLFAGAMHVPFHQLEELKGLVLRLAVVATILCAFIAGTLCWLLLHLVGVEVHYMGALVFGAVVAPTDPISALAVLKKSGLPKKLETLIAGESLLNDGVGVVLFIIFCTLAFREQDPDQVHIVFLFAREILGGGGLGLLCGGLLHYALVTATDGSTRVLITLGAVTGTYALAQTLGVSGPIAIVVLGLIMGNYTLCHLEKRTARQELNIFWKLIDDVLNAIVFMLVAFQIIAISPRLIHHLIPVFGAIVIVLFARFCSVASAISIFRVHHHFDKTCRHLAILLTWGGLRGGLSIALALSLPQSEKRDIVLLMIYGVVIFSILVQGSTLSRLYSKAELKRIAKSE
jgi:Na+:H+ antiporter